MVLYNVGLSISYDMKKSKDCKEKCDSPFQVTDMEKP
jgi:hypothetical protein